MARTEADKKMEALLAKSGRPCCRFGVRHVVAAAGQQQQFLPLAILTLGATALGRGYDREGRMVIEVLTGLLAGITGFYAWATFRIMRANDGVVSAMNDQLEAQLRPYVSINVFSEPGNPIFFLRIANIGKTGASNLRLTMDRDFYQYGQKSRPSLRAATAFSNPIEQLPPGAEMIFGLAQGFVVLGMEADPEVTPPVFNIAATYSASGRNFAETTTIDLRPYRESMEPPSSMLEELEKIRKALETLAKRRERPPLQGR